MSPKFYLITGANRGLGRGLLEALIQRPETIVVAGVRDPNAETSRSLSTLKAASGSKVIIVQLDIGSESSIKEAIKTLQSKDPITTLDIVISNAGISDYYGSADITPLSEARQHYEINTIGTLALFQATWPLLQKSTSPIFVGISSAVGSIGDMDKIPLPATAYGMSKAALNYMLRKIHFENKALTAFPLSPGWVQTDMGNRAATQNGVKEAPVTLKQSIDGMLEKIDGATKEETSGNFVSFDDEKYSW